jgi:uncharacterized paraquat-inducible protein A
MGKKKSKSKVSEKSKTWTTTTISVSDITASTTEPPQAHENRQYCPNCKRTFVNEDRKGSCPVCGHKI